jgi:hypothetical protein
MANSNGSFSSAICTRNSTNHFITWVRHKFFADVPTRTSSLFQSTRFQFSSSLPRSFSSASIRTCGQQCTANSCSVSCHLWSWLFSLFHSSFMQSPAIHSIYSHSLLGFFWHFSGRQFWLSKAGGRSGEEWFLCFGSLIADTFYQEHSRCQLNSRILQVLLFLCIRISAVVLCLR